MWDKTLKKIHYDKTPQCAAALWDADKNSVKLISDGINLVYRFTVNKAGKYLRITHPALRTQEEILSAIDYQKHLFLNSAPVCEPVLSKNNLYVEEIMQDNLIFLAHAANEMPGKIIDLDSADLTAYKKWGVALACLHQAASTYHSDKIFKSWRDLNAESKNYAAIDKSAIIKSEYEKVNAWLQTLSSNQDNFGLTHGDHRSGNVLYDGKAIHIIDFDEPVYHWFAADIARVFLELCIKPFDEWKTKFQMFIEGYSATKIFDEKQLKDISWFIRMKNLEMYLWTKHNSPPNTDAQWLRERLQIIENPLMF